VSKRNKKRRKTMSERIRRPLAVLGASILMVAMATGTAMAATVFCTSFLCVGTQYPDTILGSGGANRISALGGNDYVAAGGGDDTVNAGDGYDKPVNGNTGNDTLYGGYGVDELRGSYGNDPINGGPERDHIYGDADKDILRGEGGDDIIEAADFESVDRAYGGDGNDYIGVRDNSGDDFVDAGNGTEDWVCADLNDDVINAEYRTCPVIY
jgi:Ca2+-binding RTX toxin-like protein